MTGVDGVAGNAADDVDSLALAAGKTHVTHHSQAVTILQHLTEIVSIC